MGDRPGAALGCGPRGLFSLCYFRCVYLYLLINEGRFLPKNFVRFIITLIYQSKLLRLPPLKRPRNVFLMFLLLVDGNARASWAIGSFALRGPAAGRPN
jgi:hypothetical protein